MHYLLWINLLGFQLKLCKWNLLLMGSNQWLVLMLFARSSMFTRARPPPREVATTFFEECWYPDKLHQNRDIGGENALGIACCWTEKFRCPRRSSGWTKRKTEKTKRELEEYKKRQHEEYNNLRELCTCIRSYGNSQSSTPTAWTNEHVLVWCVDSCAGLMCGLVS